MEEKEGIERMKKNQTLKFNTTKSDLAEDFQMGFLFRFAPILEPNPHSLLSVRYDYIEVFPYTIQIEFELSLDVCDFVQLEWFIDEEF